MLVYEAEMGRKWAPPWAPILASPLGRLSQTPLASLALWDRRSCLMPTSCMSDSARGRSLLATPMITTDDSMPVRPFKLLDKNNTQTKYKPLRKCLWRTKPHQDTPHLVVTWENGHEPSCTLLQFYLRDHTPHTRPAETLGGQQGLWVVLGSPWKMLSGAEPECSKLSCQSQPEQPGAREERVQPESAGQAALQ